MSATPTGRPPFPPFTRETAAQKVRMAEDGWNTRDPERVSLAYTVDSTWRNRAEFLTGRPAIVQFLQRKWVRELDYRLIKELWAFHEARIAVRFAYEWRDDSGHWFRSYGNENWEFDGTASCAGASRASTTCRSRRPSANIAGRSAAGPTIIRDCPTSDCDGCYAAAQGRNQTSRAPVAFLAPYKGRVGIAFIALVTAASCVLALGQGLRHVIDAGFGSRDPHLLNVALGAVVAVSAAPGSRDVDALLFDDERWRARDCGRAPGRVRARVDAVARVFRRGRAPARLSRGSPTTASRCGR